MIRTIAILLIAASGILSFGSTIGVEAQGDEFLSTSLGSQWFWVREDPRHWSLTAQPGALRITTQFGDIAGTMFFDAKNILLQGTRSGDWVVDTRVNISPLFDFQQGGLIAYDNDDNYVKVVRGHVAKDGGDVVEMISEVAGVMTFSHLRVAATDVYLRITKTADSYHAQYSTTGNPNQWFTVGTATNALGDPKVGLVAFNGPFQNVPTTTVDFAYFRGSGPGFGAFKPLLSDVARLGTRVFVDVTAEPDAFYRMAASLRDKPGIKFGSRTVPLNLDMLFLLTLSDSLPTVFRRFGGYLNARGEARAWIDVPNLPGLAGGTFYLAYVTLDSGQPFGVNTISLSTEVKIKP